MYCMVNSKLLQALGCFSCFLRLIDSAYKKMRLYTEIGTQEFKTGLKIKQVVICFMQKEG